MKKLFTTLALFAFAAAASAGTAFTTYDVDYANAGQGFDSQNEVHVGAAFNTKYGVLDAAVVGRQLSPADGARDNSYGFEVGYSKGVQLGAVTVTGRAALGRINHVDTNYGGFIGNTQYYSLAAEASLPVTEKLSTFVGYRFRDAYSTGPTTNRYTVGVDYAITPTIGLCAGYAFTKSAGTNFNGLTTAISYKF
jgi:hypothetical protein